METMIPPKHQANRNRCAVDIAEAVEARCPHETGDVLAHRVASDDAFWCWAVALTGRTRVPSNETRHLVSGLLLSPISKSDRDRTPADPLAGF